MNFFRKLFGSKPATPPAATPAPQSSPTPPPAAATPPPAAPVAPAPAPRVTFSSVTPSGESAPAPAPQPVKLETTLLTIDGPVWLPGDSPAIELLPAKPDEAPIIAFLGGSAELPPPDASQRLQLAGDPGRLARALPLYLADQVELGTDALTRTLVSWLVKPMPGFILGGKNWDDATASRHARGAATDDPADYLVVTHLRCLAEPWTIELRLVRTIDAACLGTATVPCPAADPGQALESLARELFALLAAQAELPSRPPELVAPASSAYLLHLDQLLAVRTAGLPGAAATLRGEGEILDGQLRLCAEQPDNIPARLLLVHTARALKTLRPAVVAEYRERIARLHADRPLAEPAQSVAARILADTFAG